MLSVPAIMQKAFPTGETYTVFKDDAQLGLYYVLPGEACILTSSCLLGKTHYQARGLVQTDLELVVLPPATFRALFSTSERNHQISRSKPCRVGVTSTS